MQERKDASDCGTDPYHMSLHPWDVWVLDMCSCETSIERNLKLTAFQSSGYVIVLLCFGLETRNCFWLVVVVLVIILRFLFSKYMAMWPIRNTHWNTRLPTEVANTGSTRTKKSSVLTHHDECLSTSIASATQQSEFGNQTANYGL